MSKTKKPAKAELINPVTNPRYDEVYEMGLKQLNESHQAAMLEEGDVCPMDNCDGILELPAPVNCSCHVNPPCPACMEIVLTCPVCGWESDY